MLHHLRVLERLLADRCTASRSTASCATSDVDATSSAAVIRRFMGADYRLLSPRRVTGQEDDCEEADSRRRSMYCTGHGRLCGAAGAARGPHAVSAGRPGGPGQRRRRAAAGRRRQPGAVRSRHVEVRHRLQPTRGLENLESGEAEDDAGRQGDRRHACSAPPIPRPTARWRMPATTSSGPRCSTTIATGRRSRGCGARVPNAKAVPGVRVAYTDEREIQHALDAGALVIVVPTVDTVAEAIEARNWTYFPPLGRRSNGGGQAFDPGMWGGVPGGYRQTINDNIVLILMIETLEGLKKADEIAKVPGVTAVFAASGDLGNFSGYRAGLARLRARDQHRPRRRDQGGRNGCAARLRGATVPTSRASRPAASSRRLHVASPRSSARLPTHRPSRRSARSRNSEVGRVPRRAARRNHSPRTRRKRGLLAAAAKLLELGLCLRVLRVELHGLLEIPDRGLLVALRVLRLRHRGVSRRGLREVLEVRLQVHDRVIGPLRVQRAIADPDQRVLPEVGTAGRRSTSRAAP